MNDTVEAKQQKHEILDSAIDNVYGVLHATERLYEKIMDTTPEDKPCEEKYTASLNTVLENGAARLNKTTEEIHLMINKIEGVLFG